VDDAPGGGAPSSTSVRCRLVRLRCRGSLMSFTRYVLASSAHLISRVCCAFCTACHVADWVHGWAVNQADALLGSRWVAHHRQPGEYAALDSYHMRIENAFETCDTQT